MAKNIDESKLMRIKEAAIELIVEKGYGEASISAIAAKADVAAGYLYRFYPGKRELVTDLLDEKIRNIAGELEEIMESCNTISEVIESLVNYFFQLAARQPDHIRFLYSLINEYRFSILPGQLKRISDLCSKLLDIGRCTGEISESFSEEEIFIMAVIYPIGFINIRFKQHFSARPLSETDKQRVVKLCMAALKG